MTRGQLGGFGNLVLLFLLILMFALSQPLLLIGANTFQNSSATNDLASLLFWVIPFSFIGVISFQLAANRT